jgi:hypothetical protein
MAPADGEPELALFAARRASLRSEFAGRSRPESYYLCVLRGFARDTFVYPNPSRQCTIFRLIESTSRRNGNASFLMYIIVRHRSATVRPMSPHAV